VKRAGLAVVVVFAFALAGCGHGKPAITKDASNTLQAKVAQIRISASNRDASAVTTELAALRNQVADLQRNGQLSPQAAQRILDAATGVDQNLSVITTTTTSSPPDHGHGKGNGDEGGD
jgi:hypothetical protein